MYIFCFLFSTLKVFCSPIIELIYFQLVAARGATVTTRHSYGGKIPAWCSHLVINISKINTIRALQFGGMMNKTWWTCLAGSPWRIYAVCALHGYTYFNRHLALYIESCLSLLLRSRAASSSWMTSAYSCSLFMFFCKYLYFLGQDPQLRTYVVVVVLDDPRRISDVPYQFYFQTFENIHFVATTSSSHEDFNIC